MYAGSIPTPASNLHEVHDFLDPMLRVQWSGWLACTLDEGWSIRGEPNEGQATIVLLNIFDVNVVSGLYNLCLLKLNVFTRKDSLE